MVVGQGTALTRMPSRTGRERAVSGSCPIDRTSTESGQSSLRLVARKVPSETRRDGQALPTRNGTHSFAAAAESSHIAPPSSCRQTSAPGRMSYAAMSETAIANSGSRSASALLLRVPPRGGARVNTTMRVLPRGAATGVFCGLAGDNASWGDTADAWRDPEVPAAAGFDTFRFPEPGVFGAALSLPSVLSRADRAPLI